jgi:hypothetical protein
VVCLVVVSRDPTLPSTFTSPAQEDTDPTEQTGGLDDRHHASVAAQCPGGEFPIGHQVATMMGGMRRTFDGGYAEYTCVPARQVGPFTSDLQWSILGAVPETLQTAYGSPPL